MKLTNILQSIRALGLALLSACAFLASNAMGVGFFDSGGAGGVDLATVRGGASQYWAVFGISGGVSVTDPGPFSGNWDIRGGVGIAGSGNLTMSSSEILGNLYIRTGGVQVYSAGATVTGSVNQNSIPTDGILSGAAADAATASAQASALPTFYNGSPLTTIAQTTPIALAAAAAANTTYVLHLTDLILSGTNAMLTLNGNGLANVNYVINVNRYLSLANGAQIKLTGGLQVQNVLINVQSGIYSTYTYDATLSGGSTVNGIILAPNRTVKLTGASTDVGEVIGKAVSLSGNSRVYNPVASP